MYQEHEGLRHHEGQPEKDCGCGGHGEGHHGPQGHHGMGGMHHGGYRCCQMHHMGGFGPPGMMGRGMGMGMRMGMGFGRRFISRDEIIGRLEEYLKELQAEAKGVQEHIAELKRKGESQQA